MENEVNPEQPHSYRIGAVARLTGISVDRLRAWERRYGVVETRRTEALGRIYTRGDVERLSMIKQLVDLGNPISSVARLSDEQLRERVQKDAQSTQQADPFVQHPVKVIVSGRTLAPLLRSSIAQLSGLQLASSHADLDALRQTSAPAAEVLILEYAGVYDDTPAEVTELLAHCRVSRAVLVVGFGRREHLQALRDMGAIILRSPVSIEELELACRFRAPAESAAPSDVPGQFENAQAETQLVPARRFQDADLVRLAVLSRSVECECPEHLITLIGSLTAFEAYSATCRSRNPDDAALHAYLHRITAQARALIEEALENVAEMEGLTH